MINGHKQWWWMAVAIVGLVVIGMGIEHLMSDMFIAYPLDTWRMDFDDLLGNIGTLLIGIGTMALAIVGVRKERKVKEKIEKVETKLNGGMNAIVERLVADEMAAKGYDRTFLELLAEVEKFRNERDECREKVATCLEENEKLKQWVVDRLDESGNGRSEERGSTN